MILKTVIVNLRGYVSIFILDTNDKIIKNTYLIEIIHTDPWGTY